MTRRAILAVAALLCGVAAVAGCTGRPVAGPGRCDTLRQLYGLTPCPADPVPVESPPVSNLDPKLSNVDAHRLVDAYLRSRTLYYTAVPDNSEKFFRSGVIDVPAVSPMMFDAETGHMRDAKAAHGSLVLLTRSTLTAISVVPLPDDLRHSLGVQPLPMADGLVVRAKGPEQQVIRAPGHPDRPVDTLAAGDGYTVLIGGVLVHRKALPETFAELGQWDCFDPDTEGACKLTPSGSG